jgi:hypothetical protein
MEALGYYWLVWNQHPDQRGNAEVFLGKKA